MNTQQFTVNEKTDITFMCTASGSPAPSIFFIYEGQILNHTDVQPKSLEGTLIDRAMLGSETVSMNTLTGLYEVTGNLTLFNAMPNDSLNFVCSASSNIPGTGETLDNTSFSLLVYRK